MVMITLGSSNKPKKSKVGLLEKQSIIYFNDKVYEIKISELRNLGLDNLDEIVKASIKRGLDPMPHFSPDCLFCGNNSKSIEQLFYSSDSNEIGLECSYKSDLDLKIAVSFTEKKTGRIFRAIQENCAFYDSLAEVLIKKDLLGEYKQEGCSFNYKPISDFEKGLAKPKEFEIQKPNLYYRIKEILTG
jgi:hypothetical protein